MTSLCHRDKQLLFDQQTDLMSLFWKKVKNKRFFCSSCFRSKQKHEKEYSFFSLRCLLLKLKLADSSAFMIRDFDLWPLKSPFGHSISSDNPFKYLWPPLAHTRNICYTHAPIRKSMHARTHTHTLSPWVVLWWWLTDSFNSKLPWRNTHPPTHTHTNTHTHTHTHGSS